MRDVLKPFGCLDVLDYYSRVAAKLARFLKGRELSTKIWIPGGPKLLKRGSQLEPLYIEELAGNVDDEFLRIRSKNSLPEARERITPVQERIWKYFFPRKLCDFLYATNREGPGRDIDRIFFDIDRNGPGPEEARIAAQKLLEIILDDSEFKASVGKGRPFLMWTGRSFHVYYLLEKPVPNHVYDRHVHFSKSSPLESFTGRWADRIAGETGLRVAGGHEKKKGFIVIDPSQTPSGKLARSPFSLHMKDARTIDGVALPVETQRIHEKGLLKDLSSYTPQKVLEELDELAKAIPPPYL